MSINMEKPIDLFKVPTVTYNAELEVMREMRDTVGLYKERQFSNNHVKVLTTIYEEIGQLWSIPIQYRPNFEVKDGVVTATTLFAEVQGMFEKKEKDYLKEVMSYVGENTIFYLIYLLFKMKI